MVVAPRILATRSLPLAVSLRSLSRAYSSSTNGGGRVQLVYDHHEPPNSDRHRQDAPIIFMHGLFGSKKNNRSVSNGPECEVRATLAPESGTGESERRKNKKNKKKRRSLLTCFRVSPSQSPGARPQETCDLRNHGESPHVPRHDYVAMADDVAGFISEHGLKEPTLIGHSMGAKTALTLALDQPSLIADVVSVDNAPVDAALSRNFATYIRGMRRVEDLGASRQSEADQILADYEPDVGIRQFLLGNLYRTAAAAATEQGGQKNLVKFRIPLDTLARSLDHLGDFPFRDPNERRFEKPALFVRGTHSKYVPDEVIPVIGRFFPRFSLVDVEAGHWVISEKPAEFLKAVVEFLTPKE
ncbi:alpha beta hydrolase fold family [Xylariaceae sp. FL1651]|nr:alpha beta hydrolase fold family [Xylariaceae sp. FL1651]